MNGILNAKFKRFQAIQPPKKSSKHLMFILILIEKNICPQGWVHQLFSWEFTFSSAELSPTRHPKLFVNTWLRADFYDWTLYEHFRTYRCRRPGWGLGFSPVSYKEELGWFFYPQYPQNHRVVLGWTSWQTHVFCFFCWFDLWWDVKLDGSLSHQIDVKLTWTKLVGWSTEGILFFPANFLLGRCFPYHKPSLE